MMKLLLQESEAESAHSRLCREPDEGLHGLDCAGSLSSTTLFACYLLLFPVLVSLLKLPVTCALCKINPENAYIYRRVEM
jgi:hypothetical protein